METKRTALHGARDARSPLDVDHDGIADAWERERGLDSADPEDRNADRDGDGYTNLEEYLGWLAGEFR